MLTATDAIELAKAWKLYWGRNLTDSKEGMGVLLEDCQRLCRDREALHTHLQNFRRMHERDIPSWNQFAAYVRSQKAAPPMSFTLRPPLLTSRPDGESVRISPSRWREHDAMLGISDEDDGEQRLDVGDPRVGEYLRALRAGLPNLVGRLRAREADRFTRREERDRREVHDDPKALAARQAMLMGGPEYDVPNDQIPF